MSEVTSHHKGHELGNSAAIKERSRWGRGGALEEMQQTQTRVRPR